MRETRSWLPSLLLLVTGSCGDDKKDTQGTEDTVQSASGGTSSASTGPDTLGPSTTGSSSSADTAGLPCADGMCGGGEVCVVPCCGGGQLCLSTDAEGKCSPEDTPIPPGNCRTPCATEICCLDNCIPAPPYCTDAATIMCNGDSCTVNSCSGEFANGQLYCFCA